MSTSSIALLEQARTAAKAGRKQQARQLLQLAVRENPHDYRAWLWLASVTTSPKASLDYVRRAEMLMPNDPAVQKARAWAERRLQAPTQPTNHPTNHPSQPRERPAVLWASVAVVAAIVLLLGGLLLWNRFGATAMTGPIATAGLFISNLDLSQRQETAAVPDQAAEVVVNEAAAATPAPVEASANMLAAELPAAPRLQAKNIAPVANDDQASEPRPTWTVTPVPTNTPTPEPTPIPTFTSAQGYESGSRPFGVGPNERWINVNLTAQTLTAYEGDQAVFSSLISSGTWNHPTVTGQFRIWLRYESQTMDGRRLGYNYYLENVPYVMYFYRDYALHGTYWHNNFGTPMSHGCVNMTISDAAWLFNWSSMGTVVNVHH